MNSTKPKRTKNLQKERFKAQIYFSNFIFSSTNDQLTLLPKLKVFNLHQYFNPFEIDAIIGANSLSVS